MTEKFIKNEQFNFIRKQVAWIKDSTKQHLPPGVLASVYELSNEKISNCVTDLTPEQKELMDFSGLKTVEAYEQAVEQLPNYLLAFPTISEQQLKKLFPKSKKLKLPDLSNIDLHRLTYLSWNDSRSNKKYILYKLDSQLVGIECSFSPSTKKNICSICHCHGEVTHFSTITKAKKVNNPDYYKSIGNLICVNSTECNKNITDVSYLEEFLRESLKK
ncbi:FusB/FusC family EF-G-binding protein [Psychrobacillus sp. FSL K6-2684]|uniref:FusB/FusC family EF-G-binding protein n=1 Tax=unclassified Psychrobacillus TaxID=2636677 RepID=UPI001244E32A|nr:FusB/FusC family EF-G-binding protein [Psychrobacillus sp. AK 1817]QEY20024.1 elongation factor G-binding protein [Psychrobacillus sp. AK 1817]